MEPNSANAQTEPVVIKPTAPTPKKKSLKFTIIILGIIILLLVGIGGGYYLGLDHGFEKAQKSAFVISPTPSDETPIQVGCTMEAKLCPDGSSVGRSGPKCEFAACPQGDSIDLSKWETYTSARYKFTVKYPQGIVLDEGESGVSLGLFGPTQKRETEFYYGYGIYLLFSPPKAVGTGMLIDLVQQKLDQAKQDRIDIVGEDVNNNSRRVEAIKIGNYDGFTYTVNVLGTFQMIYLLSPYDPTMYIEIANAVANPTNQGYQKTVTEILSTFQFTN